MRGVGKFQAESILPASQVTEEKLDQGTGGQGRCFGPQYPGPQADGFAAGPAGLLDFLLRKAALGTQDDKYIPLRQSA